MVEQRQRGRSGIGESPGQRRSEDTAWRGRTDDEREALRHEARRASERAASDAKREARELAEEKKAAAARRMKRIAGALRAAGDELYGSREHRLGSFSTEAANRLERASDDLEQRDPGRILRDGEDFARRYPDLFLGGLALTGILVGRFLRSSARSSSDVDAEREEWR